MIVPKCVSAIILNNNTYNCVDKYGDVVLIDNFFNNVNCLSSFCRLKTLIIELSVNEKSRKKTTYCCDILFDGLCKLLELEKLKISNFDMKRINLIRILQLPKLKSLYLKNSGISYCCNHNDQSNNINNTEFVNVTKNFDDNIEYCLNLTDFKLEKCYFYDSIDDCYNGGGGLRNCTYVPDLFDLF